MLTIFRRTENKKSAVRSTSFYIARTFVAYWLLTWLLAEQGIGPALLSPNKAVGMATAVLAAIYLVIRLQFFLIVPGMTLRLLWLCCSAQLLRVKNAASTSEASN